MPIAIRGMHVSLVAIMRMFPVAVGVACLAMATALKMIWDVLKVSRQSNHLLT